ncbi:MAG: AAA family ATPase, partial [Deltaproteobacteria bacterium]|nr:AAA family ATPase [Deltaproteobacteria bacterium]
REFNVLQPSIQELDHELTQIISETRYLENKIGSKYHVSLKEVANQFPPEDYPEEETRTKLEKLEGAQERMIDEINFNSEREYEEQVEKYQFYQTQSEDLNKALNSLQEAINKINQTSRERFQTTFHKVNENFKAMLPLVFEGGQGELVLTDESDLLETGVEIMVQPAGKSLKNINLLSGGEKSLAAISLLFALYLIKPTPFCLLDEVDSPLDDANVDRFIAILKKFAPDSQFLLITHNKKTMEIADTLYGITMEEPGISKIVSVRLN